MKYLRTAIHIVFSLSSYRVLAFLIFVLFFSLYLLILPATYTGGRIGLISLQFITPILALFAFLFALLLAFIFSFSIYAFKRKKVDHKNSSTFSSMLGTVIPPLLCCSPLLPTLAAIIAGIFPFIFGVSGFIQGFIATYEIDIFIISILILIYSLEQNAKQVVYAVQRICDR